MVTGTIVSNLFSKTCFCRSGITASLGYPLINVSRSEGDAEGNCLSNPPRSRSDSDDSSATALSCANRAESSKETTVDVAAIFNGADFSVVSVALWAALRFGPGKCFCTDGAEAGADAFRCDEFPSPPHPASARLNSSTWQAFNMVLPPFGTPHKQQ